MLGEQSKLFPEVSGLTFGTVALGLSASGNSTKVIPDTSGNSFDCSPRIHEISVYSFTKTRSFSPCWK
ncbi:hypothetical protein DPMN_074383 [Dreissena polymorpha]|uniref:Uncharacterized protein n=1 Tax=Dreissena polymorpha TaxID=45954 RepID=A0A9D3YII4_DREPO|nr:hypothetical protein DPMN_074383 [Dreissena polymorpha]